MNSRRDFLQGVLAASGPLLLSGDVEASNHAASLRGERDVQVTVPPTASHVGTLYPFIHSQAVRGEFPLSFLSNEFNDLPTWKRQARGRFLELLHYAPPACDPRAEVAEKVDGDGYVREEIFFSTTPDIRVPACVLIPKGLKGKAPAVVALHDHGGMYLWGREKIVEVADEHPVLTDFKEHYYGGRSIASELARQGYVVIAIDMFYWGERRMLLDDDPFDWREQLLEMPAKRVAAFNHRASQLEQLVARTIYAAGFTWSGVMYWDDFRTVDYLLTRPEVDAERIGCVGLSMGGLRTVHLAALDDRIKAAVAVGWMASYPAQLKSHVEHTIGFTKLVPGLMKYMDYPDVASMAMPAAWMVINGSKDTLFELDGVRSCFDKLSACYKKAGVAEQFKGRLYDTPHEFNREMQVEAWDWLGRWLRA